MIVATNNKNKLNEIKKNTNWLQNLFAQRKRNLFRNSGRSKNFFG